MHQLFYVHITKWNANNHEHNATSSLKNCLSVFYLRLANLNKTTFFKQIFHSLVHLKYSQCARHIVNYNIYVYYYAYIIHKIGGWAKLGINLIGLYNNLNILIWRCGNLRYLVLASKTKIILLVLNRKHSQLNRSGSFPCLAQLLILLWLNLKVITD